ncbi:GNAT family N-acetyltransferase [Streptomonospora nanhaiensis]|uniref:Ribosomal protein S18 acetylase RimI-like enzyme n=1 Tax=Streptomonospora nanhaiensis TaxID=1323731 RepID=A0A853BP42_9ACTN|nr:GNAT family N-acetyltransferase [Streptomonospora nanhaiensis]MBV2364330.1 GNAT family N-acetyltransferase [Streptomonospora nanhaiensis]MBX9390585.1 GNAT family N-acetyltransferase [Streptomonospora nanhaiensis]NYI97218.1 ribosomal protein S18 acetylase RimI-like enzyme [Streptomonospora nanhaiensis]
MADNGQPGAATAGGGAAPVFRLADEADIPLLVELVNSAYRGDSSRKGWTTEADLLGGQRVDAEGIAELLARPGTRVIVAEVGGDPVACCELAGGPGADGAAGGDAYFGMFCVRPDAQGGGLGARVLAEAERVARQEFGCRRMRMTVLHQREDLIAFYERRGYRRTGRFEPFPYGDPRFGLPKRPDLVFAELAKPLTD